MSLTNRVTVVNQYLFLVVVLLLTFLLLKEVFGDVFRGEYQAPKIELVANDAQQPDPQIAYSKVFQQKVEDVYIFAVKADKVIQQSDSADLMEGFNDRSFNMFSGGSLTNKNTVNFMFVREEQSPKLLFNQHAMITSYKLFRSTKEDYLHLLSKNLYLVVSGDTNQDGF